MFTLTTTTTDTTIHGYAGQATLKVELWHDGTLALEQATIADIAPDYIVTERLFEGNPNESIAAAIVGIMDAAALAHGETVAHRLGLGVTDWLGVEFCGSVTAPAWHLGGF